MHFLPVHRNACSQCGFEWSSGGEVTSFAVTEQNLDVCTAQYKYNKRVTCKQCSETLKDEHGNTLVDGSGFAKYNLDDANMRTVCATVEMHALLTTKAIVFFFGRDQNVGMGAADTFRVSTHPVTVPEFLNCTPSGDHNDRCRVTARGNWHKQGSVKHFWTTVRRNIELSGWHEINDAHVQPITGLALDRHREASIVIYVRTNTNGWRNVPPLDQVQIATTFPHNPVDQDDDEDAQLQLHAELNDRINKLTSTLRSSEGQWRKAVADYGKAKTIEEKKTYETSIKAIEKAIMSAREQKHGEETKIATLLKQDPPRPLELFRCFDGYIVDKPEVNSKEKITKLQANRQLAINNYKNATTTAHEKKKQRSEIRRFESEIEKEWDRLDALEQHELAYDLFDEYDDDDDYIPKPNVNDDEEEGEGEDEGAEYNEDEGAEYNEEEEKEIVGAINDQIGEAAAESDKTADADDIYNHVNRTVGVLCGVSDFNLIAENDTTNTTMLANIASAYEQNSNQRKGKRAH